MKRQSTPHGGMHISVQPMAGRQISKAPAPSSEHPAGKAAFGAMQMDQRDLSKIEPKWSKLSAEFYANQVQAARLTNKPFPVDEMFGQR